MVCVAAVAGLTGAARASSGAVLSGESSRASQPQIPHIIPPTSQNQARIEADLYHGLTAFGLGHSDQELQFFAERLIRNYDPCISCSVLFLDLRIHRI
jgi:hypothetical protein